MALELKDITKRDGADIHIHETNLTLAEEGFNILLGTTLSGKTTLMQLMAGIDRPSAGEIWFDGKNVTGKRVQDRNVSMVYQQFINYPNLTVFENIASPLRVARLARGEIAARVEKVAELLRLGPMLKRYPGELSGGQQQRTALARALVKDADLVLLDEPLANLDYKLREELRDELPKLFADRHCTVVYATTEPVEALLLGGHTALLHEGHVVQFGPTSRIYREPESLLAARVFSDPPINMASVTKRGASIVLANGPEWDVGDQAGHLPDGEYTIAIRPHHIEPRQSEAAAFPISGNVLVTEISGSESVIHFDLGGEVWVSQSHGVHAFEVGESAVLYAQIGQAIYFDATGNRVEA